MNSLENVSVAHKVPKCPLCLTVGCAGYQCVVSIE